MGFSLREFLKGLKLIPDSSNNAAEKGDLAVTDSDGKLNYHNGSTSSPVITESHTATVTNKTIDADNNTISNLAHGAEVDEPSSGVHGVTGSIVGTTDTQTLTNKTIDFSSNTIQNAVATDSDAIHDNVSGEINALTEKGSPVGADLIIIEDSADSNNKKKVQITNLPGGGGTDADAIHDNVASEISAITEKTTPISADLLVIEDSADSNNKKRVQIGNLPSGSGGTYTIDANTTDGTITSGEADGGTMFVNTGSSGTVVMTLPSASAGLRVKLLVTAAQNFQIEANTGDDITMIDSSISGVTKVGSATIGSTVELVSENSTNWYAHIDEGSWSEIVETKMYIPGGSTDGTDGNTQTSHQIYDATGNSFSAGSTTSLTATRDHGNAGFDNDGEYFNSFGNTTSGTTSNNTRYTVDTNTWDSRATSSARDECAMSTNNNASTTSMYTAGNQSGTTTTEEYDKSGNSWSTKGAFTFSLTFSNGTMAGDGTDVYTLGGAVSPSSQSSTITQYDVSGNSWSNQTATLSSAVIFPTAVSVGADIHVAGGRQSGAVLVSRIDKYDTVGDSRSTNTATLAGLREAASGGKISGLIYYMGGTATGGGSSVNTNDEFDPVGDSVTSRATMTTGVQASKGAVA